MHNGKVTIVATLVLAVVAAQCSRDVRESRDSNVGEARAGSSDRVAELQRERTDEITRLSERVTQIEREYGEAKQKVERGNRTATTGLREELKEDVANIKKAVDMGMKHMEHTDTMARSLLAESGREAARGQSPESMVDPQAFPPLIDYLVKQGVYVNPTLVLIWGASTERWRDWTGAAAQLVKEPGLAFVPADVKAAWVREPGRARAGYANVTEFLRRFSEAGGKILAATDAGCCAQIVPGLSLHYEMQMLTDMGISPMKAIQGATLWSAEVIGQQKDLGSIEPGKLADITVIEGNPLADIGATKNVRMVIKGGEVMNTTYDPAWVNPIPRRVAPAEAPAR